MQNKIREILKEKVSPGYSVDDFVKEHGIGKTSLYDISRGRQVPSLVLAIKISKSLKRPIQEIFPDIKEVI